MIDIEHIDDVIVLKNLARKLAQENEALRAENARLTAELAKLKEQTSSQQRKLFGPFVRAPAQEEVRKEGQKKADEVRPPRVTCAPGRERRTYAGRG